MIMAFYYKHLSFSLYPLLFSFFVSVYLLSWIEATKNVGITIDLIHRDSPLSPFYKPSETRFERLRRAYERSFSRKSSLELSSIRTNLTPQNDFQAPIIPNGGTYLMKIEIGTPPVEFLVIADTGSDLVWTQCLPCTSCYPQQAPLFDPSKTSTYTTVSCQAQQCSRSVGATLSCDNINNVCKYISTYMDRSYTIGDLAIETFTFDSSVSFPGVVFGCGHQNGGTFRDTGSGLIGLGGGPLSIISQLSQSIGGKFSYCLTLLSSNVASKISFGANAIVTGPNVVSTPLIKKDPVTSYYLTLEGISVGTNRLNYMSTNNSKASVDEGNIIIDSGTTLTLLPSDLYGGLESALVGAVRGNRVSDSQGKFKVCYQKSSDFSVPPLIVHFTGADVELAQENTFLEVEQGVVCLTLLPSDGLAIFGNLSQMNYEIGYDIVNQKVNFLPTDCSKSQ